MRMTLMAMLSFILSIHASDAKAHDFWLHPSAFQGLQVDTTIPLRFRVGHANDVEPWALTWDRVVALRSYSENGFQDQLSTIIVNNQWTSGRANIHLNAKGTHLIGFESYHSVSTLSAKKFNDYAQKEGLSLVLEQRNRLNQSEQAGIEIYSRKAKTIVQVGDVYSENVTRPIGHMLEIVPISHPYQLSEGDTLPIQVLFRGRPLENALVDMAPLEGANASRQEMRTNKDGKASFNINPKGSWMINVIWAVPIANHPSAEFETYFSSLTFGY